VLLFTAFSKDTSRGLTNIRRIPVIITSLDFDYPTEVDYIETSKTKQPFPTVLTISLNLKETHSPSELQKFDLIAYRKGILEGF
jgi:hypothetical protein